MTTEILLKKHIPNALCLFRIGLIVLFIPAFLCIDPIFSASIFMIAALTDWLDGYLARSWNVQSELGAFLDPVADKMMIACALIFLTFDTDSLLILLSSTVLILREIAMSSLRHWACLFNKQKDIPVNWMGKLKTATSLVAISVLLLARKWLIYQSTGCAFLALSAILSALSLAHYALLLLRSGKPSTT